jgi:8-oxo-dGTP diphosphatase
MSLFLVRHAKAGRRSEWHEDDSVRPLDEKGWAQANAIGVRIAAFSPTQLFSSPFLRCAQTLEPLATLTGLTVHSNTHLEEGTDFASCVEWLSTLADGAVMSSHGDVIPPVIEALERRGMQVEGMRDSRKASVWVLERQGDAFIRGTVWAPPKIE